MIVAKNSIIKTDVGELAVMDIVFFDNREFAFCVGGRNNFIYEIFDNGTPEPKLKRVNEIEFEVIYKIFLSNHGVA